jgi:hypothetical protein
MADVKERTTAYLTVTFKDKNGVAVAPNSASYRIDCLTSGQAVKAPTALAPASSIEITLTPADNAIRVATHVRETKRVTVSAIYGASDEVNDQYDYDVVNLSHHP